jgi:hypothetical protein
MSIQSTNIFSREQLYQRVWSKPLSFVANKVGVSAHALARICNRLLVPYPSRGHWKEFSGGRRSILTLGICVSLAGVFLEGTAVLADAAGCADPDDLSGADLALRKSVEYTDSSLDDKTCRRCAFFKASSGKCGTCQIVTGLVSAGGHCTSWSARVEGK